MAKQKIAKEEKQAPKYELILSMKDGETYSSSGQTISECLANFGNPALLQIKTWGTFTLKEGKKKAEMMRRPIQIKRLLSKYASGFTRDMFEKSLTTLLK